MQQQTSSYRETAFQRDRFQSCGIVSLPATEYVLRLCHTATPISMKVQYHGPIMVRPTKKPFTQGEGSSKYVEIEGWFRARRRRTFFEWISRFPREQCEEIGREIPVHIECYPDREDGSKGVLYLV